MIKYIPELTDVVLEEIPDRVTLALEIPNCQGSCPGCHSSFLKLDIGKELTPDEADRLIEDNFGINCFLLLGEGNDREALLSLAAHVRERFPRLELALYSGRQEVEPEIREAFDFVKVGRSDPVFFDIIQCLLPALFRFYDLSHRPAGSCIRRTVRSPQRSERRDGKNGILSV